MKLFFILLVISFIFLSSGCFKDDDKSFVDRVSTAVIETGSIEGEIEFDISQKSKLDYLKNLQGVTVRLIDEDYITSTDASGNYSFPKIPVGEYQIEAIKGTDYQTVISNVKVNANITTVIPLKTLTLIDSEENSIEGTSSENTQKIFQAYDVNGNIINGINITKFEVFDGQVVFAIDPNDQYYPQIKTISNNEEIKTNDIVMFPVNDKCFSNGYYDVNCAYLRELPKYPSYWKKKILNIKSVLEYLGIGKDIILVIQNGLFVIPKIAETNALSFVAGIYLQKIFESDDVQFEAFVGSDVVVLTYDGTSDQPKVFGKVRYNEVGQKGVDVYLRNLDSEYLDDLMSISEENGAYYFSSLLQGNYKLFVSSGSWLHAPVLNAKSNEQILVKGVPIVYTKEIDKVVLNLGQSLLYFIDLQDCINSNLNPKIYYREVGNTEYQKKTMNLTIQNGWSVQLNAGKNDIEYYLEVNDGFKSHKTEIYTINVENTCPSVDCSSPGSDFSNPSAEIDNESYIDFFWSWEDAEDDDVTFVIYLDDDSNPYENPMFEIYADIDNSDYWCISKKAKHRFLINSLSSGVYTWGIKVSDGELEAKAFSTRSFRLK